jgi:hypothetical protein
MVGSSSISISNNGYIRRIFMCKRRTTGYSFIFVIIIETLAALGNEKLAHEL